MEIKNIFIKETSDNLAVLENELNKPNDDFSPDAIDMVIRTMHNIKGTAPMVGFNELPEIAIPVEITFKEVKSNRVDLDESLLKKTQIVVSVIQELLYRNEEHTAETEEEQRGLIEFFNDINRLKAQTND